jgi:hypothetical protein
LVDKLLIGDNIKMTRVIYAHAIKKDGGYAHATTSSVGTGVPCIELLFTYVPFWMDSVGI